MNISTSIKLIVALSLAASFLFACNPNTSNNSKKENKKLDSLKQDSIGKADFMAKYDRYYNDISRFMAGLEQTEGSSLAKFDTLSSTKKYHS